MKKYCLSKMTFNYIFAFTSLLFLVGLLFLITPKQMLCEQLSVEISFAGKIQKINCWFDEQEERHYLFLPSSAKTENIRLSLPEGIELAIEGQRFKNGEALSGVSFSGEYQPDFYRNDEKISGESLTIMTSSNLASIYIETETGSLDRIHNDKNHKEAGRMSVFTRDGEMDYDGDLTHIKGRGNYTWTLAKKPYNIKLPDASSLLGMGKGFSWVLLANANDKSGLRNRIAYETARDIDLTYAIDETFVDLYVNHEYQGLYQLTEAIEIGEERVDIEDLSAATQAVNDLNLNDYAKIEQSQYMYSDINNNPLDITGGYIMEMEHFGRYVNEDAGFITDQNRCVVVKFPQYITLDQTIYISNIVQQTEDAIFSEDGINPSTGRFFTEYIDLNSWAKRYLLDEIFMNYDSDITSSYFYKHNDIKSPLLYAGPIWDYDSILRHNNNLLTAMNWRTQNTEALFAAIDGGGNNNIWYQKLYKQNVFYSEVVKEYENTFLPILSYLLNEKLDSNWKNIEKSTMINNIRWKALGFAIDYNGQLEQIEYLKSFIERRIGFLNSLWIENEKYYEVNVDYDGGLMTFYLKRGETLWDEISRNLPALLDTQFYIDNTNDILFDMHSPITEGINLYTKLDKPAITILSIINDNPNIAVLTVIMLLGIVLLVVEMRTNCRRKRRGGDGNIR